MLALVAVALVTPVSGDVVRAFDYAGDPFAPGHHRGLDLAAAPRTPVRAACSGRVTFAGRAGASGRAVTVRCGAWSVTHLPLATVATRAGATLVAGAPLGSAAGSRAHAGLHLGVRRADDRFGYVDPAPLLHDAPPSAPLAAPRAKPMRLAPPPPPHPAPFPTTLPARPAPSTAPAPRPAPAASGSSPAPRPAGPPLAPWPAWAGLALLLAGAFGAGTARAARRRRAPPAGVLAREVR